MMWSFDEKKFQGRQSTLLRLVLKIEEGEMEDESPPDVQTRSAITNTPTTDEWQKWFI